MTVRVSSNLDVETEVQQPRAIGTTYHKEEMRLKLQMATDTIHHMYRVPFVSYVITVCN